MQIAPCTHGQNQPLSQPLSAGFEAGLHFVIASGCLHGRSFARATACAALDGQRSMAVAEHAISAVPRPTC